MNEHSADNELSGARVWRLSQAELQETRDRVAPWARQIEESLEVFGRHRWSGEGSHSERRVPALHLDDVSAIPFLVDISGVEEYQHRARLRAQDGDLFATMTVPTSVYEEYCRQRLLLGQVEHLVPPGRTNPLEIAHACLEPVVLERLVSQARQAGRFQVHPYMGIEATWHLAGAIAEAAEVPVEVLAPPPPVTWIANDKARFEDLVELVLGREWLVESQRAGTHGALTDSLLDLATRHRRVALKRLRCASAMGNLVLESAQLESLGRQGTRELVDRFLVRTEWAGDEEVLTVAWEDAVESPSTQLWLPAFEDGPPRLDGIYDQILAGEEKVFVGSRPTALPLAVQERLAHAALRVAAGLQALGYVGRCSFDHLVVGDPDSDPVLRFTECNGRWGGTSTPMNLVDRIVAGSRPPYRAQDFVSPELIGRTFAEVLARVGSALYDPATGEGRFVFYNVGPLTAHGKLDVIALGETQEAAEAALLEELPDRLGVARP